MTRNRQLITDEVLANALAVGKTVTEAARTAGVSERTAYRRLTAPAVRARVTEVRGAALSAAAGKLGHGMTTASDRLIALVGHENPHVQIRAAAAVIQLALQVRKEVDAADRLDQPEAQARRPVVVPAFAAEEPGPAELRGDADTPAEDERPPAGNAPVPEAAVSPPDGPASGEPTRNLARPSPSPVGRTNRMPDWPIDQTRSGQEVRRWAVTSGLLLLAGLVLTRPTSATAGPDLRAAATHPRQTCQNLTEPAKWVATDPGTGEHRRMVGCSPIADRCRSCPSKCRGEVLENGVDEFVTGYNPLIPCPVGGRVIRRTLMDPYTLHRRAVMALQQLPDEEQAVVRRRLASLDDVPAAGLKKLPGDQPLYLLRVDDSSRVILRITPGQRPEALDVVRHETLESFAEAG